MIDYFKRPGSKVESLIRRIKGNYRRKFVASAMAEGRSSRVLLKNYKKDGEPFWNDLSTAQGKQATKALLGYLPQELGLYPDLTVSGTDRFSLRKGLMGVGASTLEYLLVGSGTLQITTGVIHYGYRIIEDILEGRHPIPKDEYTIPFERLGREQVGDELALVRARPEDTLHLPGVFPQLLPV